MTRLAEIAARLAPVLSDRVAVAMFADRSSGLARFFVGQNGDRFVIEDSATGARHSLAVEHTSAERLAAHVDGFIQAATGETAVDEAPAAPVPLAERPEVARVIDLEIQLEVAREQWETARAELWSLPTLAPRAVELRQAAREMLVAMQTAGNRAWSASHGLRDLLPRGDYYRALAVIRQAVAARPRAAIA